MENKKIANLINMNLKLKKRIRELEIKISIGKNEDVLSVKEVLEILNISRKTFDRYVSQGLIKVSKPKLNGRIFIKKSEIENTLKIKRYAR